MDQERIDSAMENVLTCYTVETFGDRIPYSFINPFTNQSGEPNKDMWRKTDQIRRTHVNIFTKILCAQ